MDERVEWQRISIDTSSIAGKELFPFPLTIMERFLVWDDSASYPKRFQIVVSCDGSLDVETWLQALKATLLRHPMLLARIDHYDRNWVFPEQSHIDFAVVDWASIEVPSKISPDRIADAISLRSNDANEDVSNLRMAVVKQPYGISLAFDVYHPACDGLGMRMLIEDVTSYYNALMQNDESLCRWKNLEPSRLLDRGDLPAPKEKEGTRKTSLWEKLVHAYHFHFRPPSPIYRGKSTNETACQLQFRSCELNFEQNTELRDFFLKHSINANEWATYCLLETIRDCQLERSSKQSRARITIPIDLRVWDDLRLSGCNKIGFAFVVSPNDRTSKQATLQNVKVQFEMIRTLCLGSDFVRIFQPFQNIGGFVRAVMRRLPCLATAVLTNLGDVTARQRKGRQSAGGRSSSGDLRLKSIHGWPPIRQGTQIGVGLCRYDQQLSIAAVFDGAALATSDIDLIFNRFVSKFQSGSSELA